MSSSSQVPAFGFLFYFHFLDVLYFYFVESTIERFTYNVFIVPKFHFSLQKFYITVSNALLHTVMVQLFFLQQTLCWDFEITTLTTQKLFPEGSQIRKTIYSMLACISSIKTYHGACIYFMRSFYCSCSSLLQLFVIVCMCER